MNVAKTNMPLELLTSSFIDLAERGLLPDFILRAGMRKLCKDRLRDIDFKDLSAEKSYLQNYIDRLKASPIAVHTREANEQHYEVPSEFFKIVLGKNLKYSSAYFPDGVHELDLAEDFALSQTMERAEIRDGMRILELGCGWGSLTLAMARKFPNSRITALSNSRTQKEYILAQAKSEGLTGIEVVTRNIADPVELPENEFDRVVSVEMFEHLKNYELLFSHISRWLKPNGKLFVHIFTHCKSPYPFETDGEENWMGRYFFTGGQMPSHDLLLHFQNHLQIKKQWAWSGIHYAKTAEAWLVRQDQNSEKILTLFKKTYGEKDAARWVNRWRMFFMACAELFGYADGSEWGVSHYLFENKKGASQ